MGARELGQARPNAELLASTGPMYTFQRIGVSIFMMHLRFTGLAIVAVVSVSGLISLHAQTTRAGDQDTGSTITSLTRQRHPRAVRTTFGGIQAAVIAGAGVEVFQPSEVADAGAPNDLKSGGSSRRARSRSSVSVAPNPAGPSSPLSSSQMQLATSLRSRAAASVSQRYVVVPSGGLPPSGKSPMGGNRVSRGGDSRPPFTSDDDVRASAGLGRSTSNTNEAGSIA